MTLFKIIALLHLQHSYCQLYGLMLFSFQYEYAPAAQLIGLEDYEDGNIQTQV